MGEFISSMLGGTLSGVTGVTNLTTTGIDIGLEGKSLKIL